MSGIDTHVTRTEFKKQLDTKQDVLPTMPALLGRASDQQVIVVGRPGYVWMRIGNEEALGQARNRRVPNHYDLKVIVGYDATSEEFQVLSIDQSAYLGAGYGAIPEVAPHGNTHQWPQIGDAASDGSDTVHVVERQRVELRISIDSPPPFQVTVNWVSTGAHMGASPVFCDATGRWMWVLEQSLNLAASVPAMGARYILVYLDAVGILTSRNGVVRPPATIHISDVPVPLSGELPLAAVFVFAGQTALREDRNRQDIIDLRYPQYRSMGSASVDDVRKLVEMGW